MKFIPKYGFFFFVDLMRGVSSYISSLWLLQEFTINTDFLTVSGVRSPELISLVMLPLPLNENPFPCLSRFKSCLSCLLSHRISFVFKVTTQHLKLFLCPQLPPHIIYFYSKTSFPPSPLSVKWNFWTGTCSNSVVG